MTDGDIQYTVMNGLSYSLHYFLPSSQKILYSMRQSEQNNIILLGRKRGCTIVFSPFNRC